MRKEKEAKAIIIIASSLILVLIPLGFIFLYSETYHIKHDKLGTFGDFFGGTVGAFWSLGAMILFYLALTQQREDFLTNKEALLKQIEALNLQSEEFKLQREELRESRKVFSEQAKTLKQQRLESLYFSLLNLYNHNLENLNSSVASKNYFKDFKEKFEKSSLNSSSNLIYIKLFHQNKESLSLYFKTIYRIIKIIDEADIDEDEKLQYSKILRSQLSEYEMFALYYNSISKEGGKFYIFILKYNLLKHLPSIAKIEFQEFQEHINQNKSIIMQFHQTIYDFLDTFLYKLHQKIDDEDFTNLEESQEIFEDIFIELKAYESYRLEIIFSSLKPKEIEICKFKQAVFIDYFKLFLKDIFIFSRYENSSNFLIEVNKNEEEIEFLISSKKQLLINSDKKGS